ncbi:MAG: hypothetical protein AAF677_12345 [Pseudomonadota bacterium]
MRNETMATHDTLTLYFCGSGNNRKQTNKYLIPSLYERTRGKSEALTDSACKVAIYDGPGGSTKTPEYVTRKVQSRLMGDKPDPVGAFASGGKAKRYNRIKKINEITGAGATSNVLQAWSWIRYQLWANPKAIKHINMVGFSRGGYSCIMLAHVLNKDPVVSTSKIKVNIFAFDPVPGGFNLSNGHINDEFRRMKRFKQLIDCDPTELPPIVNRYHSIVQENVKHTEVQHMGKIPIWLIWKDKNFQCVVPKWKPGTDTEGKSLQIYPMPGHHSASANFDPKYAETLTIGRHLCEKFLKDNGTELTGGTPLTPNAILANYTAIKEKCLKDTKSNGYKKKPTNYRGQLIENAQRGSDTFVNEHHYDVHCSVYGRPISNFTMNEDMGRVRGARPAPAQPAAAFEEVAIA